MNGVMRRAPRRRRSSLRTIADSAVIGATGLDARIVGVAEFAERIRLEIERCRRYERPFALSMFSGLPTDAARRLDVPPFRTTDAATVVDGRLLVLWSEVDEHGAAVAATRLAETFRLRSAATVAFPADGLTLPALVDRLDALLDAPALPRSSDLPRLTATPSPTRREPRRELRAVGASDEAS